MAKVTDVMQGKKEEVEHALMGATQPEKKPASQKKAEGEKATKNAASAEESRRVVSIGERQFEVLTEYRINATVFEALAARSAIVMNAIDRARRDAYDRDREEREKPAYKHTILMGQDDVSHNLRASISVFANGVVVQTLRAQ